MGRQGFEPWSRAPKARIFDRWTIDPKVVLCLFLCGCENDSDRALVLARACFDCHCSLECHTGPCRLQTLPGPSPPKRTSMTAACLDGHPTVYADAGI